MKSDFSGYATKNDIRCSDGRVIRHGAFADMDGVTVPLVYQHDHNDPTNILGHALLENRDDGVYAYGFLNHSEKGEAMREAIAHGDINAMSIYANRLQQNGPDVVHGTIREVSLVVAGANPGALIDNVTIAHGDGFEENPEEAVIYTDEGDADFAHGDDAEDPSDVFEGIPTDEEIEELEHADASDGSDDSDDSDDFMSQNVGDVINSMNENQKAVLYSLVGMAANDSVQHSDDSDDSDDSGETVEDVINSMTQEQKDVMYGLIGLAMNQKNANASDSKSTQNDKKTVEHSAEEGEDMNVFDQNNSAIDPKADELIHSEEAQKQFFSEIQNDNSGRSFYKRAIAHAQDYGIKSIDVLFPDAKSVRNEPDIYKRDTAWVAGVLSGTSHTPFSRIKSTYVDVTSDEARAKGFTLDRDNNKRKIDEVVKAAKRQTTPTTVYKKQRLDRDDVLDITEFNVVNWMMREMRIMLDEEIARAILIGDGREASAEDHINEESIRPIVSDDDLYVLRTTLDANATNIQIVDGILTALKDYRGSGQPVAYMAPSLRRQLLVERDQMGRRLYDSDAQLATEMSVAGIVEVPLLENFEVTESDGSTKDEVKAIIVNLKDYTVGTDRGGDITSFTDFDIDYNQHKYLMETRLSGALTLPKSALVVSVKKA